MRLIRFFRKEFLFISAILLLSGQTFFAQNNWSLMSRTIPEDLVSVWFTSSDKGWIGGDNGYLAATLNGGRTWTKQPLATAENVNEIYFRNENNGYLLAGSRIYRTKDGGKNWRENIVLNRNEFKNLNPEFLSIRFTGKKRGWIVGSLADKNDDVVDSLLLKTEDSGETWQRIPLSTNREIYHLDFTGDERGWIVGDKGLIMKTEDGGSTWRLQNSGTNVSLHNVDFRNSEFGIAVGSGGTVLRTENGGITWNKVNTGSKKSFLRVNFTDDKTGWIVGAGGTILQTQDGGLTWNPQNAQVSDSIYGLYSDKKSVWAVGKKGLILRYGR